MDRKIFVAEPSFIGNEKKYVSDCMDTTWVSSNGAYVSKFEEAFASFLGCSHAVSTSSGTVALHVSLVALGLKPGDEVLVPALTYIATANAVTYCGAKPVFVDCLTDTWNIDIDDARKKVTPKTKGIIPVHLYGNPCDMDAVMQLAKEYNLFVLEDAAECHGATYRGQKAGTFGQAGAFSFFGNKIIATGEGGGVVTNDLALAAKIRKLKGQGQDPSRRYWFTDVGYNYRMTNIEAAIGLAQIEKADIHIENRKRVASWYLDELSDLRDKVAFQKVTDHAESVWWMFSILLKESAKVSRDALMEKLNEAGIETRPFFYPLHVMPAYEDPNANCPVSESVASRGINLPTHGKLTREDVKYIADCLRASL